MQIPKYYNHDKSIFPPKRIIFFSGAGISQPSGINTFRDTDGLWENHKIEDICTQSTWKNNFDIVHDFYNTRRIQLNDVKPNIAHKTIANIINKYGVDNVYNITQNVDDLFEKAGCEVLHLHGQLTQMQCEACDINWRIGTKVFDILKDRCPKCKSLKGVKPNIVFFGGSAPMYGYLNRAMEYIKNPNTIVIVIGTMGNVVPIWDMLEEFKCKRILCNMESSDYIPEKHFDKVYFESAETAILKIEKDIEEYWNE